MVNDFGLLRGCGKPSLAKLVPYRGHGCLGRAKATAASYVGEAITLHVAQDVGERWGTVVERKRRQGRRYHRRSACPLLSPYVWLDPGSSRPDLTPPP
ncbi:hypothetical protein E2562_016385 [Oryza meyeriana var. granulata]|uniref:Uncharacterized protein n=1 Tax=Oryza meyeriana var. granulata TaxID=110450 RepID=A0A6G1EWY6_9ORYZ|nr:hypothetical protein E2562_016385 [Oryza meyeriana var. granulata]